MCLVVKFHYKIPGNSDSTIYRIRTRSDIWLEIPQLSKEIFLVVLPFGHSDISADVHMSERAIWENNVFGAKYHQCELAIWDRYRRIPEFGNFAARDLLS